MTLNYVTLILDGFDGGGTQLTRGTATFTPSIQLTDPADQEWIPPAPVSVSFREGLASPQVSLLATDNPGVGPAGWGWRVSFLNVPGTPAPFNFFLPFTGGSTQRLSALQPVQSVVTMAAYMPLAGGAFTGAVEPAAVTLTDAPVVTAQSNLGNLFRLTLTGNHQLVMAGGVDGQLVRVDVIQGPGGPWSLTYGSMFDFGASGAPTLSTATGARDVLGLAYTASTGKWLVLAFANGY